MAQARAYLEYPDGRRRHGKWTGYRKAFRDMIFLAVPVAIEANVKFGRLDDLLASRRTDTPEKRAFLSAHRAGVEFKQK